MHVVVDGVARAELDSRVLGIIARRAAGRAGMSTIGQPHTVETPDTAIAFQLIAESHISIHLNRHTLQVWFDIFSCKAVSEDVPHWMAAKLGLGAIYDVKWIQRTELS